MILVIAGTRDGRELARDLTAAGYPVIVSVFSEYGKQLAAESSPAISAGALDEPGMVRLLQDKEVALVVDASHPYAVNVSHNAMAACAQTGAAYLRFEREETALPADDKIRRVADARQAAQVAAGLGNVVFLTTGSHLLPVFKAEPALADCRLIARVLPQPDVIAACSALGFAPKDLVAMQGPFSHQMNVAMFRHYGAEVVVTKNSGHTGGTDSKLTAARELGLFVVVIDRPRPDYPQLADSAAAVLAFAAARLRK
ncbi:MAG TPA: precorrin-6A reductase [Patescibacteria group bacterium]|nr:precorrin-6A reductase [Patescibacteria group bacterium]